MRLSLGVAPVFGSTIGSPVTYGSRRRSLVGSEILAITRPYLASLRAKRSNLSHTCILVGDCFVASLLAMTHSNAERRHVQPAPLGPAFQAQLGKLHAFGAFGEIVLPRRAGDHVADE